MSNRLYLLPALIAPLSRLGVDSAGEPSCPDAICIVASITNFSQVENAHGSVIASSMRNVVHERARQVCQADGGILTMCGAHLLFVFDSPPGSHPWGEMHAPRATVLLERIFFSLGDRPVETSEGTVFPVIAARVALWNDAPFNIAAVGVNAIAEGRSGQEWRERYVADMSVAATLFNAMDEDRLGFEWEPVHDANGESTVRYFEALLCQIEEGVATRVGAMVAALERLGLVRRLDQWVVESVIDALRLNRDISLGCNVSAQSATLDAWWAFIVKTLSEEPDIAARLIIEITETTPLMATTEVRVFVKSLQSLGCRVALDDVGAGHSNVHALVELGVDIVKIDAVYLRQAGRDVRGAERFRQLVGLAKTCAASVVIEGVESADDAEVSRSSGADWLQGYLFSKSGPRM
ncbi:EAL domain-containing protein [Caballeronia sp. LjRoot34]|uniref:EAL domain-containing protein n=1 Tax=Caballeronia sp. LjRoot34 TaxID=3342325 RepID=UPI003ECF53F5